MRETQRCGWTRVALAAVLLIGLDRPAAAASAQTLFQEGPSGGTGGASFNDNNAIASLPAGPFPIQLFIRHGSYIDEIVGVYQSGQPAALTLFHGGTGGTQNVVNFGRCEHIDQISGSYGSYVDHMNILTTTSPRFGGTPTQNLSFGGGGGSVHYVYDAPDGYAIVGFLGRSGSYIDAIGVLIAALPLECRSD